MSQRDPSRRGLGATRARLLTSPRVRPLAAAVYVATILVVLAPVLLSSVGADDRYWLLIKGPQADGSFVSAFWEPVRHAFDFDNQPRSTALSFSERAVLAMATMKVATTFAIPPFMVWAGVKIALFVLMLVAARVFLGQVRYRGRDGVVRGLEPSSIAFVTILLPVAIAIGAKSQNVSSFNGWNNYPTIAYGAFSAYLLSAALVLRLSRTLDRRYARGVVPVVALMAFIGFVLNLSYELTALIVPLTLVVLVLQPSGHPDGGLWRRWRGRATVFLSLAVPYTVVFWWIRRQISQMACQATDSCYEGTVVKIEPRTLLDNFVGALPGNNSALVTEQVERAGVPFPHASVPSLVVAVLAVGAAWVLWSTWRGRETPDRETPDDPTSAHDDTRGLLAVLVVAATMAVGSTVITGISERAVEGLTAGSVSYRSGVVTWASLALLGLVAVRLLARSRRRVVGIGAYAALTAVLVGCVTLYLPRNVVSAQLNRAEPATVFADTIHREIVTGELKPRADDRRCAALAAELVRHGDSMPASVQPIIDGAYLSFEMFHDAPYCSTGIGRTP
ncbi:hypothetical protein [Aeromicrobium endophyticum]|uniref:Uncharacterized protein n=1 Tax=Aeromicrobium endophyticum TaxID=2292704 RepID=A0A371PAR5_9ACTN|nr:hypothetical protein [Aeromicrobium endophyticum]REK72540.1 hypothetical protein DX116_02675 [Aeromicrobium endophyticum]